MNKRRLLYITLAVAALAVVAIVFLVKNLDALVERAIEKYGSAAAGTAVRVSAVDIGLQEGRGAIRGLTVANPPGFAAEPLFALGEIALDLDTASLTAEVPVIESIKIGARRFALKSEGAEPVRTVTQTSGRSLPTRSVSGSESSTS